MTTEDELQDIAAGDPAAFGRWVARVESRLRLSLRSFAAMVDTEVVVQESLLRVWQVAPRVEQDGQPDPLLRLAIRIARNLAIDETRRRRAALANTDRASDVLAEASAVRAPVPDPLLRAVIAQCRERLPKQPKAVLTARLQAGGTRDDRNLAEGLGMRLNTFLQNFGRARKLLLECMRSRGVDLGLELS